MQKIIRVTSCAGCPFHDWHPARHAIFCQRLTEDESFDWHDEFVMCADITDQCPLEDAPRWRKYPEEKPEKDGEYLVTYIYKKGVPTTGLFEWFCKNSNWEEFHNCGADFDFIVTHWMPIPEIIEGVKNA